MKIPFFGKKKPDSVPDNPPPPPAEKAELPKEQAKPSPKPKPSADSKKTFLMIGLVCIIFAFLGVAVIFYLMTNESRQKEKQMTELGDQLTVTQDEKNILEGEVETLKTQVDSIKIEKIVAKSEAMYGKAESSRKDGLLWLDKKAKTYVVTLGALNGLKEGSGLAVYDGAQKLGEVTVSMPLDVISYVEPPKRLADKMTKESYQVKIE